MTTVDQAVAAAGRLARSAALRDQGVTACHYPADGTPVQRAARQAWISTYLKARPPAPGTVDFRSDIDAVAAGEDGVEETDKQDGGAT
jgi:hypothetical protein